MQNVPNTAIQCKCGKVSPLRAARVDAFLEYLGAGNSVTVSWNLYSELRGKFDWPRGTVDQVLNDAALLNKVQFVKSDWGFEVHSVMEEGAQCSAA